MSTLTLPSARVIIDAALGGSRSDAARRIAVVVVDAGGHPLAMAREEEAAVLLSHIAEAKANPYVARDRP